MLDSHDFLTNLALVVMLIAGVGWISDPPSNLGMVFVTGANEAVFLSREATTGTRPTLAITYRLE